MKSKPTIFILIFLIILNCSTTKTMQFNEEIQKGKGDLILNIKNIKYQEKGNLIIAICSRENIKIYKKCYTKADIRMVVSVNTNKEEQKIIIKNLPYDIYGIIILHDENADFKMAVADRSDKFSDNEFIYYLYKALFLFGTVSWPNEGYGYSNYTGTSYMALDFDQFAFKHNNSETEITVKMNYKWKEGFGWASWFAILASFQLLGK